MSYTYSLGILNRLVGPFPQPPPQLVPSNEKANLPPRRDTQWTLKPPGRGQESTGRQGQRKRAQESPREPGEHRRAQQSTREHRKAQESPGEHRRAQEATAVCTDMVLQNSHGAYTRTIFFKKTKKTKKNPRERPGEHRKARRAQESTREPKGARRAQESPAEQKRAQDSPGEPRRAQESAGGHSRVYRHGVTKTATAPRRERDLSKKVNGA